MMAFLIGMKAKFYALGAALLAFLGMALRIKYLGDKADRADHRADVAEATVRQKRKVADADLEIENKQGEIENANKKDKNDGKVPRTLSDPNNF